LESVAARAADYGGFTLIVSNFLRMYCFSNRAREIEEIAPGIHGVSNHLLDTAWPKVTRGKQRLSDLLKAKEPELIGGLLDTLADRTVAPDTELPDTGVGLQRERELSSAFVAGERYGTRASTALLVSRDNEVLCVERRFGARGVPQGEARQRFPLYMRARGRKTKAAGQDV
ncbi:MAG: NRDE family protein, partial [Terriglobales bacterium]